MTILLGTYIYMRCLFLGELQRGFLCCVDTYPTRQCSFWLVHLVRASEGPGKFMIGRVEMTPFENTILDQLTVRNGLIGQKVPEAYCLT